MQMRQQPRLLGDQPPEILVDLARVERGEPQPRQFGQQCEQAPHHLAERRLARQVARRSW